MYIYKYSRFWKFASPLRPFSDEKPARVKSTSTLSTRLHPRTRQNSWKKKERKKGKKKERKKWKKKTKKKGETWKKNGTRRVRSILRVVVHLCYFNIREWPHYRILSANICALLGPRVYSMSKMFFFFLSLLFFFYGEKRNEGRSIIKIVRRVSRDPIKKVRRQHSPFCNWPWSAFIFACNRKCCASLSRISTGTVKIPAILVKYVQAVRSPRNLVSRPVRRPNSRSPCHGGCIAGTGRTKKYYCTSNITFNWKIRSKLKMYTISRVYLHFIFIFCNSFVDKFQF